ncbi:serine hydrolase domain-containing protein [Dactylosporangium sp. CS-033363]|uniref:serine hydrolase domain-containing protein n=1 Tax=Dactylosporangium sp. CS-033363 TaxID=3239935 RepID=UPI003D90743F
MSDVSTKVQQRVQEALDDLVGSGAEVGVQVAVYHKGEQVVDAVAGAADPDTGAQVAPETLFYTSSVAKGVASTVLHVLAERGAIGYDTRIAEVWPEFAAHGKEKATVRHALTHSAGVPGLPGDLTPEDLTDWQKMTGIIADEKPWWEPGTATGYHAISYGYIIGEIVRRVTGKPISEVLHEEVATPLGVADELFFGAPKAALKHVAKSVEPPYAAQMRAGMPAEFPLFKAAPPAVLPTAEFANRTDILTSDIPAGGVMSARAVAKMYAALLGEVDGVRLVSKARLDEITTVAQTGQDQIMGFPASRGLGYDIGFMGPLNSPTLFGMAGTAGTAGYADKGSGMTIAVGKNNVTFGQFDTFNRIGEIVQKTLAEG